MIGIPIEPGSERIRAALVERDGYPEYPGAGAALLFEHNTPEKAAALIDGGDISDFDPETLMPNRRGGTSQARRGEIDELAPTNASGETSFGYLYDTQTRRWLVSKHSDFTPLTLDARDFVEEPAESGDTHAEAVAAAEGEDGETDETDAGREDGDGFGFKNATLADLLTTSRYRERIIERVIEQYPPLFDERAKREMGGRMNTVLPDFGRSPLNGQLAAILQVAMSMEQRRGTTLVGEMGTGKTTMSVMASRLAGTKTALVICPPHLVLKWKREVERTLPGATACIIESIRPISSRPSKPTSMDLETLASEIKRRKRDGTLTPARPIYAIMASTTASLSHSGEATSFRRRIYRDPTDTVTRRELAPDGSERFREYPRLKKVTRRVERIVNRAVIHEYVPAMAYACVDCYAIVRDDEGVPMESNAGFWKKRRRCERCGGALHSPRRYTLDKRRNFMRTDQTELESRRHRPMHQWQGPRESRWTGKKRYALGDFIAKRMRGTFDVLIADEVHEYKGAGSARGIVAGNMSRAARRTLTLTGTLMGGYSSNLFFILQRFGDQLVGEFSYDDERRWIQRYGFEETTKKKRKKGEYNTSSRGFKSQTTKEKPGISPAALPYILGNTSFVKLTDVTENLPPYTETVKLVKLDPTEQWSGISQSSAYGTLAEDFHAAVTKSLAAGSQKMLSRYMHTLMAYPDNPIVEEEVYNEDGDRIAHAPALDPDIVYPKEKALVDLALAERAEGRRVMALISYTSTRDVSGRLTEALERVGLKVQVLQSSVKTKLREKKIAEWVKEGVDVVLSHPSLIQTGLDLLDFPTIVWYQPTYSTYTMRQASRRSWRIGQDRPVKIVHLIYAGTMQEQALSLIAAKAKTSMAVEGELPEEGLAAFGDSQESLHLELARALIAEDSPEADGEETASSIESMLNAGRRAEIEESRQLVAEAGRPLSEIVNADAPTPAISAPVAANGASAPRAKPRLTEIDLALFAELSRTTERNDGQSSLFDAFLN